MSKKTIEEKYQKKTQIEHILDRPDSYIGDIDKIDRLSELFIRLIACLILFKRFGGSKPSPALYHCIL